MMSMAETRITTKQLAGELSRPGLPELKHAFSDLLVDTIGMAKSESPDSPLPHIVNRLFRSWYKDDKGPASYYFLFRKNLAVTDISFAETVALLRLHTKPCGSYSVPVQFMSSKRLKGIFRRLWVSIGVSGNLESLSDKCFPLFASTILIDPFFGSAVVHIPCSLVLELAAVCGEAGFIHSCGRAIYVRNTEKSSEEEFFENLSEYLERAAPSRKKTFFVPYSHEHFSPHEDSHDVSELRHGLSDVKLYLDKFYFGNKPLSEVLRRLSDKYVDQIHTADGVKNYAVERKDFVQRPEANDLVSIFLLIDRAIEPDSTTSGRRQYYISYAQEYRNRSPFIEFNERKPAWLAPTTLPHSLSAAMLNIARPFFPNGGERLMLADPFAGTGTTFFEAIKTSEKALTFFSADLHPLTSVVIRDNTDFFLLSAERLENLMNAISDLLEYSLSLYRIKLRRRTIPNDEVHIKEIYDWAAKQFAIETKKYQSTDFRALHSHQFSAKLVRYFEKGPQYFRARLLFYLIWRASLKNFYTLGRQTTGLEAAIKAELCQFKSELKKLKELREQQPRPVKAGRIHVQDGLYSPECIIPIDKIEEAAAEHNHEIRSNQDAVAMLESKNERFNLIITDPPYGFNVVPEEEQEFMKLYTRLARAVINALTDEGQLVFCLPEYSLNGQPLPVYATKEIVVPELLLAASECNAEIIKAASINPDLTYLFEPPYFWQSERALKRTILHFRIKRKQLN